MDAQKALKRWKEDKDSLFLRSSLLSEASRIRNVQSLTPMGIKCRCEAGRNETECDFRYFVEPGSWPSAHPSSSIRPCEFILTVLCFPVVLIRPRW
jgi:hypothetical protein